MEIAEWCRCAIVSRFHESSFPNNQNRATVRTFVRTFVRSKRHAYLILALLSVGIASAMPISDRIGSALPIALALPLHFPLHLSRLIYVRQYSRFFIAFQQLLRKAG